MSFARTPTSTSTSTSTTTTTTTSTSTPTTTTTTTTTPTFFLVLALLAACGGPTMVAANGATTMDAGAASPSGGAAGVASADDLTSPAAGGADAGSVGAAPSTARGEIHVDDADECEALAAAFEKRARPQIKACYREGKKKDANLVGGVRLAIAVSAAGKLGNVLTSSNGDKALLPAPVVRCMADAVKATDAGDLAKCKGKSIAIPVQFPSQ